MRQTRGQAVEVTSLVDFDHRIAEGARSLAGWHLHGVDLRDRTAALGDLDPGEAVFSGCQLADDLSTTLRHQGAIVLVGPRESQAQSPVDIDRQVLYTAQDLYDDPDYCASFDSSVLGWSRADHSRESALTRALHDHAIDEALTRWVAGRRLVGVMGGHALARGGPDYAGAARLGQALGASYVVATGGGPGAMEAANLGAYFARSSPDSLAAALAELARVPSFRPQVDPWVQASFAAMTHAAEPGVSLGVPTWHYGHEPSNCFATAIAKYFRNATREAILLQICDAGIVFLPGAAGTVQEIFQDACENYYADESSLASMVLVGRDYWTRTLPVWPLLQALAAQRSMAPKIHLVDSTVEAAELLASR